MCIESGISLKILGIFAMPSHSHYIAGFTLMKKLADEGHEVTFINSFPQKEPIRNLKDVPVPGLAPILHERK